MKTTGLLCILAPLAVAMASSAARADDVFAESPATTGSASPMPAAPSAGTAATSAAVAAPSASCGCDPAAGDGCNCCNCCDCGPGTNPWDGTVKAGFGLRMSDTTMTERNGAAANTYNFFNPDDARIYLNGTAMGGLIKGTLNTEVAGGGTFVAPNDVTTVNLLDGIAQFELSDTVNIWTGRFLPPTDRANLDGPFYQTPYDYPFVSNYPSLLAGRDDGAAYWGQAGGGKLKWQVGAFNGIGRTYVPAGLAAGGATGPNATGEYLYIGRVTVNLLDPEPGYYTQSCYFGEKEILAIGLTAAYQHDGGGTVAGPADFSAESIDFLWEHKLANCGVLDLEGGFYKYNYGIMTSNAGANMGTADQGDSDYLQLSYMLPQNICVCGLPGRLQPFTRYQYYARDFRAQAVAAGFSTVGSPLFYEGTDVGVNYIISGYNARVTVAWSQRDAEGGDTYSLLRTGVQLQY